MKIQYLIECKKNVKMESSGDIAFSKNNKYIMEGTKLCSYDSNVCFEATDLLGYNDHIILDAECDGYGNILKTEEWFDEYFDIIEKYTPNTRKYICNCGFDLRESGLYYNVESSLEFDKEKNKFVISSSAPVLMCQRCDGATDLTNIDLELE